MVRKVLHVDVDNDNAERRQRNNWERYADNVEEGNDLSG